MSGGGSNVVGTSPVGYFPPDIPSNSSSHQVTKLLGFFFRTPSGCIVFYSCICVFLFCLLRRPNFLDSRARFLPSVRHDNNTSLDFSESRDCFFTAFSCPTRHTLSQWCRHFLMSRSHLDHTGDDDVFSLSLLRHPRPVLILSCTPTTCTILFEIYTFLLSFSKTFH